jgi:propane monooxygenase reductase subunit
MGNTHTVRFQPVGIEIEVDEDETVLHAAFRQGIMLMHGCKEGQCSACKSFLLDGEVDLDRYSTFALPDFEEAEGWTLLCRAHPYSDLEIELINYDEEVLHGGTPPRTVSTRVTAVEALTHDITRLCLAVDDDSPFEFKPGQYVDILIPVSLCRSGMSATRVFTDRRHLYLTSARVSCSHGRVRITLLYRRKLVGRWDVMGFASYRSL